MTVTTDQFITNVKRRITIPASQALMSDEDILAHGDHQMRVRVLPMIKSIRQEFFVVSKNQAVTINKSEYKIPHRAVGRTLRDVKMIDATGNITVDLVQYAEEDIAFISNAGGFVRRGFYFRGDSIVIVPIPNISTLTLQFWYELRPSKMVPTDYAAVVSAIAGNVVTCTNVITDPFPASGSVTVDIIDNFQGNSTTAYDLVASRAGNDFTFTLADLPDSLAVGNYLAIADTSPVVQLPEEVTVFLETLTAIRVCHAIGDFEGKQILEAEATVEETAMKMMLQPRITGETQKIINRDGLLRRSRFNFRRGFFG